MIVVPSDEKCFAAGRFAASATEHCCSKNPSASLHPVSQIRQRAYRPAEESKRGFCSCMPDTLRSATSLKGDFFLLRMEPQNTELFLCSFWLCRKSTCQQILLDSKKKTGVATHFQFEIRLSNDNPKEVLKRETMDVRHFFFRIEALKGNSKKMRCDPQFSLWVTLSP